MKVMELRDGWGLEHIKPGTRPDPVPGPGEVLLRMAAASVNFRDAVVLRGGYGRLSGSLPLIVLSDGAGHVVEVGEGVRRVEPGISSARSSCRAGAAGRSARCIATRCSAARATG